MSVEDLLKSYMAQVGAYGLITAEEEIELAHKIAQGSIEARDKLIQANLRLVVKIAHDYKSRGMPLEDLISEGNIGLMRASEKFDPQKGAKFSTYSSWWIKQGMRQALARDKVIRVPTSAMRNIYFVKKMEKVLTEELGRIPLLEEIAQATNLSTRIVRGSSFYGVEASSMSQTIDENGTEMGELIADSKAEIPNGLAMTSDLIKYMLEGLPILPERSQKIIKLRYGLEGNEPHTLEEVSELVGVTRERVRQIQCGSLDKLRAYMEKDLGLNWMRGIE